MKPTEKQIKVIDSVLSIIKTWKNSNDIDSPTHLVDIGEFLAADLMDITDNFGTFQIQDKLNNALSSIWRTINNKMLKQ